MKNRNKMIIAILAILGVLVLAFVFTGNDGDDEGQDGPADNITVEPEDEDDQNGDEDSDDEDSEQDSEEDGEPVDADGEVFQVGILQTTSHPSLDQIYEGTIEGLAQNGYVDGENVEYHYQNAQGDMSLLNTMASTMVEDGLDILIGIATPAQQALANATSDIPVIMGAVADPVGSGLVASLEEPGANVTGVQNRTPVEDQLAIAQEVFPDAERVGLLYSSGEDNAVYESERAQGIIEELGMEAAHYSVSSTNELQQTVAVMAGEVDFIYLPVDNTIASAFDVVVQEATNQQTPLVPTVDLMIEQGGLITVGINQFDMGVATGNISAEILAGADPAVTPVFVMQEGEILVNAEQATALGVEIPEDVLSEAIIIE